MIFLIASIISSTAIFIVFRWAKNYTCRLNSLITINYLTATLLGFAFLMQFETQLFFIDNHWIPFGVTLGIVFIGMFFLIGLSSQKAGITITTLANKLSLVFPVFFSIVWFNEPVTLLKYIGLFTAILAILLILYKKPIQKINLFLLLLPLIIFVGSGFTDSLIKYIQATQITDLQIAPFSTFVFFISFICGTVISFTRKRPKHYTIHYPTLYLGVLLGIANFGSLFYFLKALNNSQLESSLVFTLNNMLIVLLAALAGFFVFKEKLNRMNYAGFILAILSLYILM